MVKITQLGPEPGATPEVPRNPRLQSPDAAFNGLLEAVRGLGNYMEAREAYDAKLREARGELASEGGTDFIKRGQQFIERAKGLRKSVRDGIGLARDAGGALRPGNAKLEQFDQDADALERYHTDALETEVFQQAVPDMRKRLRGQVKQAAADLVKAPSRRSEDDLRAATARMIDEHRKAEVIDDTEVEQSRAEFEADIEDARIQELAKQDPQSAIDLLMSGQVKHLPYERMEQLYFDINGNMGKGQGGKAGRPHPCY